MSIWLGDPDHMSSAVRDPFTNEPAEFLFTASDNRGIPGKFAYWRGSDHHIFIDEPPENLAAHYAGGYQCIPDSESELAAMAKGDAYRLDEIKKLVPSGSFLEIGPWIGLVSYSAKQAGYDVSVIEIEQRCVDLLLRVGINAVQSDDPAAVLSNAEQTYDVIALWHSIEHLPRPWAVISAAARRLRPGGVLLVAAPNPESAQLAAFGRHWLHLDAPRHLHLLSMGAYEAIGTQAGLETVIKTTDDRLGRILDRNGWIVGMHRRAFNIPIVRGIANRLFRNVVRRRHRKPGALDGAGFTLIMQRPA